MLLLMQYGGGLLAATIFASRLQQADGLWNWTLVSLIKKSLLAGLDFPFRLSGWL
jgi:hypothetical protein